MAIVINSKYNSSYLHIFITSTKFYGIKPIRNRWRYKSEEGNGAGSVTPSRRTQIQLKQVLSNGTRRESPQGNQAANRPRRDEQNWKIMEWSECSCWACPALVSGHFWEFWIIEHQMILYTYDLRSTMNILPLY